MSTEQTSKGVTVTSSMPVFLYPWRTVIDRNYWWISDKSLLLLKDPSLTCWALLQYLFVSSLYVFHGHDVFGSAASKGMTSGRRWENFHPYIQSPVPSPLTHPFPPRSKWAGRDPKTPMCWTCFTGHCPFWRGYPASIYWKARASPTTPTSTVLVFHA